MKSLEAVKPAQKTNHLMGGGGAASTSSHSNIKLESSTSLKVALEDWLPDAEVIPFNCDQIV